MDSEAMRALVYTGAGVEMRREQRPRPDAAEVLLDVTFAGLCGTDLHIQSGEHPRARPGLIIGHEVCGVVAVDHPSGWRRGDRVFVNPLLPDLSCSTCRNGRPHTCESLRLLGVDRAGGAAEQMLAPHQALVRLPETLDPVSAALIEPTAVAVRALRRSRYRPGDSVHVIGAGPVGLLVIQLALDAGADTVTFSETASRRRTLGSALGGSVRDLADVTADVVFECTGSASVAPLVTRAARTAGTVVITGLHAHPAPIDLQDVLLRELTLIGTRVYDTTDVAIAIEKLRRGAVSPDSIVTATLTLEEGPQAFAALRGGEQVKVLLHP